MSLNVLNFILWQCSETEPSPLWASFHLSVCALRIVSAHPYCARNSHAPSCIERVHSVVKWTIIGQMAIATLYIFAWIKQSWTFSDPHFSFNGWFSLLIFYISWKNEENRRSLNFLQNTPWNSVHLTMRQFQMPLSQPKIDHLHNFGFL